MKYLLLFAAILSVSTSYPLVKTWTFTQLSDALKAKEDPTLMPYLEQAMNQLLVALFTGKNLKGMLAKIPSPSGSTSWTADELKSVVEDDSILFDQKYAAKRALAQLKKNGTEDPIEIVVPGLDVSLWSPRDLKEALRSPNTKPEVVPYLDKAYKELMKSVENGTAKDLIGMVTPVDLIPHKVDNEYLPKSSKHLIKKTKKV